MQTAVTKVDQQLDVPERQTQWAAYEARYKALLSTNMAATEDIPVWIAKWSELSSEIAEVKAKWSVRADLNTDNPEIQKRYQQFITDVMPHVSRNDHALTEKLLAAQHYTPAPDFALQYRRMKDAAALFREENVELDVIHTQQTNQHSILTGNQKVRLDEEELTIPQVKMKLDSPERNVREQAWQALAKSNMDLAPQLDEVMLALLKTRRQLAHNADCTDYRDYRWKQLDRVDYTPQDCLAFHESVREEVVPVLTDLVTNISQQLGLSSTRPWDFNRSNLLDAKKRQPLRPFKTGAELEAIAHQSFAEVDTDLAARFQYMRDHGLLDLESRPGKMTHAYCQYFPINNRPFVLMNTVGTASDLNVLFHEVGHAFHGFYSGDAQALYWNRWSPIEFVEIPSMTMEFLTLDHLDHVFNPEELERYRQRQLEGVIAFLPWAAQMDAFQHWLYTEAKQDVTIADLDAKWLELDKTFHPFIDWQGLDEQIRAKSWQYFHIFQVPFYYIEYAMCYLASVGIWRGAQFDSALAISNYKKALRLGNTVQVPELYRAAGVEFRFDRKYIRGLISFLQEQLSDS